MSRAFSAGLWLFAWDLADHGVDSVLGWASDSGIDTLQVATTYHAGWFVHPHNPNHRTFMPEDGCTYFQPDLARYASTALKPRVAAVCAERDWIRAAGERLDHFGLDMASWTICNHNSRLGLRHPECTVQNVYGDRYPHALCPAHDDVDEYLRALCSDLAHHLPLRALQLESPGYLGMKHGHHHERDLTVLSPLECALIDLCFCPACTAKARERGVDVGSVAATVRAVLDAGMAEAPDRPVGHPESLAEVAARCPALADFIAFRQDVEDRLLESIREAVARAGVEIWSFAAPRPRISELVDVYHGSVYGMKADAVYESTRQLRAQVGGGRRLTMGVRLGLHSVRDAAELADIVAAVRDGGGDGAMFYNFSESPRRTLDWIKPALAGVRR